MFASCKKDKEPSSPKETALTKIFWNGTLVGEFVYSDERRLEKQIYYDEVTGVREFSGVYEYNNSGNRIVERHYNGSDKLLGRINYTWENPTKLTEFIYTSLSGADSGQITTRNKFSYDVKGRLARQSWIDLNTEKVYSSVDLTYYENGSIKTNSIYYYNPSKELQWKTEYGPAVQPLPSNPLKFSGMPVDFRLHEFSIMEEDFYSYSGVVVTKQTQQVYSDRKYNDKGFVVSQTVTLNNIVPAGFSQVKKMRYEYIEL
jgi:hypothetical protein